MGLISRLEDKVEESIIESKDSGWLVASFDYYDRSNLETTSHLVSIVMGLGAIPDH